MMMSIRGAAKKDTIRGTKINPLTSETSSGTSSANRRNLQDGADKTVYLGGIFDTDVFDWAPDVFRIVVDLLNDRDDGWNDDIFPDGTRIEYLIGNAACDAAQASRAYWHVREELGGEIHGVIGCRCSSASGAVATISGLEQVPMISFTSTSEKLSDAADYPYFSRVVAPDNEYGQVGATVSMLRALGWKRVSIMSTDRQYSRDLSTEFQRLWIGEDDIDGTDIAYHSPAIKIAEDGSVDRSSLDQAFRLAPTDDPAENSRVIVLFGHNEHVEEILQVAAEQRFQPDSVWVGTAGWVGRLDTEGTWLPPVPGYIGVTPYRNTHSEVYQDILGRIQHVQRAEGKTVWKDFEIFAMEYLVDAIVSMARALSSVDHENRRDGALVTQRLRQQSRDGASGIVRFTDEGDRRDPQFTVFQLQNNADEYEWVDVGDITVSSADSSSNSEHIDAAALCFPELPCGSIPSDSYPVPKSPIDAWIPIVLGFMVLITVGLAIKLWRSKVGKDRAVRQLALAAKQLEQSMQGMVEVVHDVSARSAEEYNERIEMAQRDAVLDDIRWFWEEDDGLVHKHDTILGTTKFVGYHREISNQIEHTYQMWKQGKGFQFYDVDLTDKVVKFNNARTGLRYQIDFEAMTQKNARSDFKRAIHREEARGLRDFHYARVELPPLPPNIDFGPDGENLLPTITGQVIQISKVHPDDKCWAYGNVVYDPILHDAIDDSKGKDSGVNAVLSQALHDRPTSGWFPQDAVTKHADVNVMQKLLRSWDGNGVDGLQPPSTWVLDPNNTTSVLSGRIEVQPSSHEYNRVVNYFMTALYSRQSKVRVTKVEKIQNLPLWQTYAVKRETVKARDKKNPEHRVHNMDVNDAEREWLFHGTSSDVVGKIEKQGFNRAFAGKHAVAYGRGVYFARDASYSANPTYSKPDVADGGTQRVFLCRVVVGDWCAGKNGQLTPNPKPHNQLELFDSTVDNVSNPSIFVVYHDSQAYPEYLISFKQN